jgi:hypothetical protein
MKRSSKRGGPQSGVESGESCWTADLVRARLAEAADTLRRLPIPRGGFPSRLRASWPDVVQESFEIWIGYGRDNPRLRPAAPSPQAIQRLDETLTWLHVLDDDERKIIWSRSSGFSWRRLEDLDGRPRDRPFGPLAQPAGN